MFVESLAAHIGTQSADRAREELLSQMNQDPMFMAGVGIKSLGYTFLLLQTFSELEIELLKSSNKQMALTSQMYEKLKEAEFRIADDIWKSGLAKGVSQMAGGVVSLGMSALGARASNKINNKKTTELTATPVAPNPSATANGINAPQPPASAAAPAAAQPPASAAAPAAAQPTASAEGTLNPAPATDRGSTERAHTKDLDLERQKKLESTGSFYQILGSTSNAIINGGGQIAGAWYDAEQKKEEGLKQLIQMVIGNSDAQKQKLQQMYEEAAKKMEEAIQAYNSAMNASH
jgi:hypothetical protein